MSVDQKCACSNAQFKNVIQVEEFAHKIKIEMISCVSKIGLCNYGHMIIQIQLVNTNIIIHHCYFVGVWFIRMVRR